MKRKECWVEWDGLRSVGRWTNGIREWMWKKGNVCRDGCLGRWVVGQAGKENGVGGKKSKLGGTCLQWVGEKACEWVSRVGGKETKTVEIWAWD